MSNEEKPEASAQIPAATVPEASKLSASQIMLGGQLIDLKGLSVADAEKIYTALPANYQALANQYAAIAKQFERLAAIQLPKGMTLQQAFANYKTALTSGAGKLIGNPDPYLQQMDALCRIMPGFDAMADGLAAGKEAASFGARATGAAGDLAMSPVRFLEFLATCTQEGVDAVTPSISVAQAKAFGTAYAAALFYQGAERQTMKTGELFLKYPGDALMATLDNAALNVPLLRDVWPYIYAAWKFVSGNVAHFGDKSGAKGPSWDEALVEAKSEIEQARTNKATWRENVEQRAQTADFGVASEKMRAAVNVAGVATAPIVDAMQNESTVVGTDGKLGQIHRDGAKASLETPALTGPDGKPLAAATRGNRIAAAAQNIGGNTGKELFSGNLDATGYAAVATGVGGAVWAGKKLGVVPAISGALSGTLHTAERAGRGLGAGYWQGTADVVGGKPFATSHSLLNSIDRLQIKADAAAEQVLELKARAPKGGWGVGDWLAGQKLKTAEAAQEKAARALAEAEAKLATGPKFSGSKMGDAALKMSDAGTEVMGATNGSKIAVAARGAGRLVGRASPWLSGGFAVWDTRQGADHVIKGEAREATQSFASAGTVASGAAAGAAVGVWFFGVGALPGAIAGAGIAGLADLGGGLFGWGSKDIAGKVYDGVTRKPLQSMAQQQDPDLAAAAAAQHAKAQAAQKAAANAAAPLAMGNVKHNHKGATMSVESFQLAGISVPTLSGMKHMIFGA